MDTFQAAGEWAALAYEEKDEEKVAADLQQKLNAVSNTADTQDVCHMYTLVSSSHSKKQICGMQICNEGLKLMLKDSSTRELEEYKDKVSAVGANFSKAEDMQGATFAYVLYKMTEHIQVEELHNLQVTNMMHMEGLVAQLV